MSNQKSLLLILALLLLLVSTTANAGDSSMSIGSVSESVSREDGVRQTGVFLFGSPIGCTGLSIVSWYACGFTGNSALTATVGVAVFRAVGDQFKVVPKSITEITHTATGNTTGLLCNETSLPQSIFLLPTDRLAVLITSCDNENNCPLRVVFRDDAEQVMYSPSTNWTIVGIFSEHAARINVEAIFITQSSTTESTPTLATTGAIQPLSTKVPEPTNPAVTSPISTDRPNTQALRTRIIVSTVISAVLVITGAFFLTLALVCFFCSYKRRTKCSGAGTVDSTEYNHPNLAKAPYDEASLPLSATLYTEPVDSVAGRQEFRNRGYSDNNTYSLPLEGPITPPSAVALQKKEESDNSDDDYWEPASKEDDLILQLSKLRVPLIDIQDLQVGEYLGSGQFGTVNKGVWHTTQRELEVAVKSLPDGSSEDERVKFLQEAAITGQFKHPNIVGLYAIVTLPQLRIVLELLPKGDLRHYLKSLRPPPGSEVPPELPAILLSFCRQVAAGMSHLSSKGFIHRDLAARNILISQNGVCKIADFGLSRDLQYESFYTSHGGKIPVKWTAPEAINYRQYSIASDVWSYGVLLYEIWSLGEKPYRGCTNQEVIQRVSSGCRLAPPPGCPRPIYEIMISCWHPQASLRHSFVDVLTLLQQPDFHLLQLSSEHSPTVDERTRTLGEPVETAEELHKDLQQTYIK